MRKTIRKSSKITKKGVLEKIYKEYTLPIVFEKNGGLCICCNKNRADGGHHIFGRERDYYHIHPDFIVPVCNWCHSKEKSLNIEERESFKAQINQYYIDINRKIAMGLSDGKYPVEGSIAYRLINHWAWEKLIEYGYKPR